eukprot:gene12319-5993_t
MEKPLLEQDGNSSSDSEPETPNIDFMPSKVIKKRKESLLVEKKQEKKTTNIICELCAENQAVKFCPKCEGPQCESCFQTLHKRKYRSHMEYATTIEEYQNSLQEMLKSIPCPDHEQFTSNIVCFDCNSLICLECAKGPNHSKHRLKMYLDARVEMLKNLDSNMNALREKRDKIEKTIFDIENEKKIFDKFETKIDAIQDGKIHVLNLQKQTTDGILSQAQKLSIVLQDTKNIDIGNFADALSLNSYKQNLDTNENLVETLNKKDIERIKELLKEVKAIVRSKENPIEKSHAKESSFLSNFIDSVLEFQIFKPFINISNELTLKGHDGQIYTVCFSKNGKYIISGSADGTIKLWTPQNGNLAGNIDAHDSSIWSVEVSDNFIFSGSRDEKIKVWNILDQSLVTTLIGHQSTVRGIAVTQKYLVSVSEDTTVKIWNLETFELEETLKGHKKEVYCVATSPNQKYAFTGDANNTVLVWDLESKSLAHSFFYDCGSILCISTTFDGRNFVFGCSDGKIRIADCETGKLINVLEGHQSYVQSVFCTFDQKYIVSGSDDESIKIWKLKNGKLIQTLIGHTKGIEEVCQSPDGRMIVSASSDFSIKIWK